MKNHFNLKALAGGLFVFAASLAIPSCNKHSDSNPPPTASKPTVTTNAVTGVTATAAIAICTVNDQGSSNVSAKGACWSQSQNPDTSTAHTNDGVGSGQYLSNMTGLIPNTTYYFRAYALNSSGLSYGTIMTFTTLQSSFSCGEGLNYQGKVYRTVLINNQCWFRDNLNIGTMINGNTAQTDNGIIEKHCYNDEQVNCDLYGGLYQWNEMMEYAPTHAQGICPSGWHVPTDYDWRMLSEYLGGDSISGGKMKETGFTFWATPNTGATNSSFFSGIGAGNHNAAGFDYLLRFAYIWSSTISPPGTDYAWSRSLYYNSKELYRATGNVNNSFTVRCILDVLKK
jgi:uncharacterized protein (TIGR02145 family)